MKKTEDKLINILRDTAPVAAGYLTLGMGFGILMSVNGYSAGWAVLMSLLVFAGSMQYAALGLLTGGASLLTFAVTTLAVNARHIFYGVSMIDRYKDMGAAKPYLIFALTDETYALTCSKDMSKRYYLLVTLFDHCYWVAGTLFGAVVGSAIHFNTTGIDFALTALFITIFVEQWFSTRDHFAAISGVVLSVVSRIIFGADSFLIPAMIGIAVVLLIRMHRENLMKNNDDPSTNHDADSQEEEVQHAK